MAKVLVFQHVAAEPLGTLDSLLRRRGHRIRYVNFHRDPDARPDIGRLRPLDSGMVGRKRPLTGKETARL